MNVESYVKEQLQLFKKSEISRGVLKTNIADFLIKNPADKPAVDKAIDYAIDKYTKNEFTDFDFIKAVVSINNSYIKPMEQSRNTDYVQKAKESVTSTSDNMIIDVDTDIIDKLSQEYGIIEDDLLTNSISVSPTIGSLGTNIKELTEEGKKEANEEIDNVRIQMIETLQSLKQTDDSIPKADYLNYTFNQLTAAAQKLKMNKLVPVDLNFFKNNPDCVIKGNIVTFRNKDDGSVYTYNVSDKSFTCNGSIINDLGIYVPYGVTDYSKLNTLTYFVQGDYDRTTSYPSNAIVLRVIKKEVGNLHFNKQTEVAGATKFVNGVAKTDLNNCQNIIAGDSVYGALSLKLAANNGNLYNTVYCVNNAALVTGVNAQEGQKEQFSSIEQLKKLNGKNIYFISATGDPNLGCHYGEKGVLTPCAYKDSYTYTGIEWLTKVCPDAKIYGVYGGKKAKQGIKTLYSNLSKRANNFTYLENGWSSFSKREANTHTDGAKMMSDLIAAVPTNVNGYS